ncbi:proprotein convertase subtilisin/kexin type 5-like protein [Cricetulus griseus]|nr:proprotein convertase subtilisin/kexin type 5-like protein [Cricetulus griseus]
MIGGSRVPMGFPHVQNSSCLASSELACVMVSHMGSEVKSCLNSALPITSCGNMGRKLQSFPIIPVIAGATVMISGKRSPSKMAWHSSRALRNTMELGNQAQPAFPSPSVIDVGGAQLSVGGTNPDQTRLGCTEVEWIQQQVVKKRTKRDYDLSRAQSTYFNDPKWPSMWYMETPELSFHDNYYLTGSAGQKSEQS